MITLKKGNMIFIFNESLKKSIAFLETDAPFAALFFGLLFLVTPVAIFRTGFSFVEYCSGSFRSFLQSDY